MRFESRRCRDTGLLVLYICIFVYVSILLYFHNQREDVDSRVDPILGPRQDFLAIPSKHSNQLGDEAELTGNCDTIHLAFVCGGHNATRGFYTLLKSILFYRTASRLELHIFVDDSSHKILKHLFETWLVPDLRINYYHISDYEQLTSWIPNEHYSQEYGLLKLVAPSVLANEGIEKIIFLDTDLIAIGDIALLAAEFLKLDVASNKTFIGLIENQSDWYQGGDGSKDGQRRRTFNVPWRAKQKGFNTGVMLMDLVKLKNNDWDGMWRRVAEMELINYLKTTLADQDIMNAVIKEHGKICIPLGCKFNIQLNNNNDLDKSCPGHHLLAAGTFSLLHWNSPYKLNSLNKYSDYYRKWYETFANWNAKLLEKTACLQAIKPESKIIEAKTKQDGGALKARINRDCRDIRPRLDERIRTYVYFLDFQIDDINQGDNNDVTLAVHLSIDRIRALDELAANWHGPISAAIYLSETEISMFMESVRDSLTLAKRRNIGYHLAFRDHGLNYPINRLRNLALNQTITPFVYLTDVDFLPAINLYDYLRDTIGQAGNWTNLKETALVVPAFETREYKFEFPRDKRELMSQLDLGTITKFRDTIWPQGQAATQYDTWKQATKPYMINWRSDYEPFIVVHKDVIRFDERFSGFGWNKVEHVMLLAASGYKFYVLPEAFAIHQYHSASYDISLHRRSIKYQSCIRLLKELFISELRREHAEFFTKLNQEKFSGY